MCVKSAGYFHTDWCADGVNKRIIIIKKTNYLNNKKKQREAKNYKRLFCLNFDYVKTMLILKLEET